MWKAIAPPMQEDTIQSLPVQKLPSAQDFYTQKLLVSAFIVVVILILFLPRQLPRVPDLRCFCAVICDGLPEPRVLKCILGCDAFGRIILKDFAEKVDELFVKRSLRGNDFLLIIRHYGNSYLGLAYR